MLSLHIQKITVQSIQPVVYHQMQISNLLLFMEIKPCTIFKLLLLHL